MPTGQCGRCVGVDVPGGLRRLADEGESDEVEQVGPAFVLDLRDQAHQIATRREIAFDTGNSAQSREEAGTAIVIGRRSTSEFALRPVDRSNGRPFEYGAER